MKGHTAGIQVRKFTQEIDNLVIFDSHKKTSREFGEVERSLKRDRQLEGETVAKNEETVYRDRKGKKLDMLSEFMRQQSTEESKKLKLEQAQFEWGKGSVQKKDEEEFKKELAEISQQPFARTADDPRLEALRKTELRDGDPMLTFFKKKEKLKRAAETQQEEKTTGERRKPLYEGPLPTPNRLLDSIFPMPLTV